MNIAKYCKEKGMNLEEFMTFKGNIEATAQAIASKQEYTKGMYYPVSDIINPLGNSDLKYLIINELKKLGFEFIEEYTLYRY